MDLYRRMGRLNFLGVVVLRTRGPPSTKTDDRQPDGQTAKMLSAGRVVTWDAGGNGFIEVARTIQACERLGIKTVFLTSEDDATDGAPTMLEPLPEADAIVSTSFFKNVTLQVADPGPVNCVIGLDRKVIHRGSGVGLHGGADGQRATGTLPRPDTTTTTAGTQCIE
jgi:hypothetical protein